MDDKLILFWAQINDSLLSDINKHVIRKLNDRILPLFEEQALPILRILTDRGIEYCGKTETHDYPLFMAINDIEHTKTKVRSPQTNVSVNAFINNITGILSDYIC